MYRPRHRDVTDKGEEDEKLPVLVYFHGGGFCVGSYSWPENHTVCLRLAAELPAVVLSFDYRLAPEHCLPAAHEDAAAALLWLRDQLIAPSDNPWLAESADPRRVFVSGVSAGGSLAHHMAVRFGTAGLEPGANIVGYILLMPGLFSAEPTRSELESPDSAFLSQEMFDRMFRLGMPVGATRDHALVNPFAADSPSLEHASVGRMLMVAAGRDFFRDRNVEYAERMKAMGKDVELVVFAGQEHAFFGMDPASDADAELVRLIKRFVGRDGNINP
jgi:acetyl esterase/lipase